MQREGIQTIIKPPRIVMLDSKCAKERKLKSPQMFDMKYVIWLPLKIKGNGPSLRSKHIAALYGEREVEILLSSDQG